MPSRGDLSGSMILAIRCKESTHRRFKRLAADFKNYEEALLYLVELYENQREVPPQFR